MFLSRAIHARTVGTVNAPTLDQPTRDPASRTLLAVDGDALCVRARSARAGRPGALRSHTGDALDVTVLTLSMLAAAAERLASQGRRPSALVVAFDSTPLLRSELSASYKAQRPQRLSGPTQASRLRADLVLSGVRVLTRAGLEADDLLAAAAAGAHAAGWRSVLVSPDADLFQALTPSTELLQLTSAARSSTLFDLDAAAVRFGVDPGRTRRGPLNWYLVLAALRGDVSDNVAGVPGVGPVHAARVADVVCSLDDLADTDLLASVLPARLVPVVSAHRDMIAANVELLRLRPDGDVLPHTAPLPPPQGWRDGFERLGVRLPLARLTAVLSSPRAPNS